MGFNSAFKGLKPHSAWVCRDARGYRRLVSIERRHRFWALHETLFLADWCVRKILWLVVRTHLLYDGRIRMNYFVIFVCVQSMCRDGFNVPNYVYYCVLPICNLMNLVSRSLNPLVESYQIMFESYTFYRVIKKSLCTWWLQYRKWDAQRRFDQPVVSRARAGVGGELISCTPAVLASKCQIIYWLQILIPLVVGIKSFCLVLFVVIFSGSWPRLTL